MTKMMFRKINFINTLPEDHFINIIAFNDTYDKLFSSPKPATSKNKSITLKFIKVILTKNRTDLTQIYN